MPENGNLSVRSAQARHAAAVRWRKPNQAETARDLAYVRLDEYIRQIVESAPPLTSDQRAKLALLLHGSLPNRGAAA